MERDFGPTARGEEPAEDLLVLLDGRPIGLLQRCRLRDWPVERAGIERHVDVPERSLMIDYLIGDPQLVGRGIGSAMIRAAVEDGWRSDPEADAVVVPVVAANKASWKALENAGLVRVGEGDIEPDNPVDDSLHYIYRIDRPSAS